MKKTATRKTQEIGRKQNNIDPDVFVKLLDMDNLSKNMFMKALNKAKELCGGSQCELSRKLGLELRRTQYWFSNYTMPHYEQAKKLYPKLLAIIEKETP